jgi:hypothetical protein
MAISPTDLITPLHPLSLWVPIVLLGIIILAAAYFVRLSVR